MLLHSNFRGSTRAVATSQIEFFIKIVIAQKLVATATKSSTLVLALVLNPPANFTGRRIRHNLTHFYTEHIYQPVTGMSTKTISYLGQNFIFENIYKLKFSSRIKY